MWTYDSATGNISNPAGDVIDRGYSGHGADVNVPSDDAQEGMGPIPAGLWDIGIATDNPQLGPLAIPLMPCAGTNAFGRSGFFIHGDEVDHAGEELASHGCIVLGPKTRLLISLSVDKVLQVV
jgi:hypothetical protein